MLYGIDCMKNKLYDISYCGINFFFTGNTIYRNNLVYSDAK